MSELNNNTIRCVRLVISDGVLFTLRMKRLQGKTCPTLAYIHTAFLESQPASDKSKKQSNKSGLWSLSVEPRRCINSIQQKRRGLDPGLFRLLPCEYIKARATFHLVSVLKGDWRRFICDSNVWTTESGSHISHADVCYHNHTAYKIKRNRFILF